MSLMFQESGDEHVNDEEGSDNLSQSSDDQHQLSLNSKSTFPSAQLSYIMYYNIFT